MNRIVKSTGAAPRIESRSHRLVALILRTVRRSGVKIVQVGGGEPGKSIKKRKRFILVDTLGLWLAVKAVAASLSEKAGAKLLLTKIHTTLWLMKLCSRIQLVWADGGYQGEELANWVGKLLKWTWQVVKRNDDVKGFVGIPKRWVVEKTAPAARICLVIVQSSIVKRLRKTDPKQGKYDLFGHDSADAQTPQLIF